MTETAPQLTPREIEIANSKDAIQNPFQSAAVDMNSGGMTGIADVNAHKANIVLNMQHKGDQPTITLRQIIATRGEGGGGDEAIASLSQTYHDRYRGPGDYTVEQVLVEAGQIAAKIKHDQPPN